MKNKPLDIAGFLKLVIEALNAAGVEYLIGGAIAEWAWGEPRATQDLDLVAKIPIKSISKLSKELKKRDMLIPAEIILDTILEERADIPINAIHMYSGLKADLYPVREGDELRQSAFQRRIQVDYGPPNWKGVYPFTRGPHSLQAHVLWTKPAIEAFPRYRSHSQVKEKRAGYELY